MSFIFGRRHSVASTSSAEGDAIPRSNSGRRSSAPDISEQSHGLHAKGVLHEIFHKHHSNSSNSPSDPGSPNRTDSPPSHSSENVPSKSHTRHESGTHESAAENIPSPATKPHHSPKHDNGASSPHKHHLTMKDVEIIFSGAPYFMLEKGKGDRWFPQVIFPFDDHDPAIQCFWDRRPLPHASYTLCTLHAHLPVPDDWVIEGDAPVHLSSWKRSDAPRRATFDVGVQEIPNMLALNGRDPGTVGFRYYLELPVADAARYIGPGVPRPSPGYLHLSSLPATESFELLERYGQPYALCSDGTVHDRKKLLREGPNFWKRIGVRDIDLPTLVGRLQTLKRLRHEILHGDRPKTILDMQCSRELYTELFTKFLYPPVRFLLADMGDPHSLKVQIKALTVVLATPGAWLDFSLIDWRLHIGQLLWEKPPHQDGDFIDVLASDKPWVHSTLERKWFLVQMLLAAELLMRLDATVRVGMLQESRDINISLRDIFEFDRLRNGKLNWDLVTVRRFMDSFDLDYRLEDGSPGPATPMEAGPSHEKHHHRSFFSSITHHSSSGTPHNESAWRCHLLPSRVTQQLKGLVVFADNLGWPRLEEFKKTLKAKLEGEETAQKVNSIFTSPEPNSVPTGHKVPDLRKAMYSRNASRRLLLLHRNSDDSNRIHIGGWATRSWLSGFVIPGSSISHFLISTVLENDSEAMAKLGPVANLYGGFCYDGRSWWSKACVVSRVLACLEGTKACLGWQSSPILPKESATLGSLVDTWFEVEVKEPQSRPGKPRIKQGSKVSLESTPLGPGDLTSGAFTLPLDDQSDSALKVKITFEDLIFRVKEQYPPSAEHQMAVVDLATAHFCLSSDTTATPTKVFFPLKYNVQFISSHECRPPGGMITHPRAQSTSGGNGRSPSPSSSSSDRHRHHRLPGHPLHCRYAYRWVHLPSLVEEFSAHDQIRSAFDLEETLILDARGSAEKEAFVRAWCASVGYHAIIGRAGRTCLSCCIREARALQVKVIIRTGNGHLTPSSSVHVLYGGE
ncbi:uncharacterized protein BP01DRAFT_356234 [Aspergillus saccharolyticus JOP 1030-1]|uniref:Uncharacterized protein n=1 Tax=Aspergillus saccharolyticus JOP 1030-1 TaxID=1450539 RepID=A0A318ZI42_9EURO|nr:hypothetical protein BP01DRAFT_356234 [Aspergillus saccharolyticus JOP 1030-1]PYH46064.1 hypothetical protein BP01DRAFT_356234 [Aspergillus saccharolyticus JOP 1030-1]